MTGWVEIEDPTVFLRWAEFCRGAATTLRKSSVPTHRPIDPGPEGLLAAVNDANNRAHDRCALYLTDAYRGIGGLAFVSEFIGLRFPSVDQSNSWDLRDLERSAEIYLHPPTERPDPRFVSTATPR